MLANILLVVGFVAALVLISFAAVRRFQNNQFTITHIDNTHIELYNAARKQTLRVTLVAIMDDPLQSTRLERHFQQRLGSHNDMLLRARSPVKNGRCGTYIPANAQRIAANVVSATRHEVQLWLTYRQTVGANQRTIYIEQTFNL